MNTIIITQTQSKRSLRSRNSEWLNDNGPICRGSVRRRSFDCNFFQLLVAVLFVAWTIGRKDCRSWFHRSRGLHVAIQNCRGDDQYLFPYMVFQNAISNIGLTNQRCFVLFLLLSSSSQSLVAASPRQKHWNLCLHLYFCLWINQKTNSRFKPPFHLISISVSITTYQVKEIQKIPQTVIFYIGISYVSLG